MTWQSILLGLVLSSLMGALGYWRKALDASGVAGAILVGTLIFGMGGWIWGLLLITFFVSSSWLSHYRRADKQEISEKFAKGSRRDLGQALANGGVGALLAVVYARYPEPLLFAAFVGVMATVNADTWATELGVLSRDLPRLVTNRRTVPAGTSGGVTPLGTWAALAGALLMGAMASLLVQIESLLGGAGAVGAMSSGLYVPLQVRALAYPLLAVAGGLAGSFLDSLMGATVQGIYYCTACGKETESAVHRCGQATQPLRGWPWLNNDLVNLLASVGGGVLAASLAWIVWR